MDWEKRCILRALARYFLLNTYVDDLVVAMVKTTKIERRQNRIIRLSSSLVRHGKIPFKFNAALEFSISIASPAPYSHLTSATPTFAFVMEMSSMA